ncbi:MAG: IclR family transcriptional regulator [Microbacteriaceae bacterium]
MPQRETPGPAVPGRGTPQHGTPRGEGVLARALRLLDAFDEDTPTRTARELGEHAGLPGSSLHRLLGELVASGLLVRVPGHRYAIGSRMFELGELSPLALGLRERSLPHMQRLYEATGENVHLAVLDGTSPEASAALFVGRVAGRASIPTLSRTGGRDPLHTTGVGKALLAGRDEGWLARYFSMPLERETVHSITSEAALRADLERTRARGYAVAHEEMTLGNVSVAAALPTVAGMPPAAIGVVAHLGRADERVLGAIVAQTARELGAALRG